MFEGFDTRQVQTSSARLHVRVGGEGPPVLLLHGYPQTHACWHRVAPRLAAEGFTVVAPDLRGYGDSEGPPPDASHAAYSKRAMALDARELMAALGFARFAVVGHDRGARVAYRLALDAPGCVERLCVLDVMPTLEMWRRADKAWGLATYHWLFLAQPELPEQLLGAAPDAFLEHTLKSWAKSPDAFSPEALEAYRQAFRRASVRHATCEDYRAGATLDALHDEEDLAAGRRIGCPVLALWAGKGSVGAADDALVVWRRWAQDVRGAPVPGSGHFIPEEAPDALLAQLLPFLRG